MKCIISFIALELLFSLPKLFMIILLGKLFKVLQWLIEIGVMLYLTILK